MRTISSLLLLLIIFSCDKPENKGDKTIDCEVFQIQTPSNWNKIELKGIDSYIGGFITGKNDTIFFDYGRNTPKNNDVIAVSDLKEKKKLDSMNFPVDEMFFSKEPKVDMNQGTFHNEYYYYDKIDGIEVKIKVPKKIGNGVTSVSFNSLPESENRLYVFGHNLDTLEQFRLLKVFKTIEIVEK